MARPKGSFKSVPVYRLHRPSGQAIVTLSGELHYLGPYGRAASRAEYDRKLAEWIASGRQPLRAGDCTVAELIAAFWAHAKTYYAKPPGVSGGELDNFRLALRPLRKMYGDHLVTEFGPLALTALMNTMGTCGWCRRHLNRQVLRIKHVFRWGVANEIVPPSVHQALLAVQGFRKGKGPARETAPVKPVPEDRIHAVFPHVSRQVQAIINVQLVTGMRPGEVCIMRGRDIDTTGDVWTYRPALHKKSHLDEDRIIDLGPRAQSIIKPFLRTDLEAYLFGPADAERERAEKLRQGRKTPLTPSQIKRGQRAQPRPIADRYSVAVYRRAIARGCELAFVMPPELKPEKGDDKKAVDAKRAGRKAWRDANVWHPHQLRHNAATWLRKEFGLDVARIILGHTSDRMTAVYAEQDRTKAREIMGKVG